MPHAGPKATCLLWAPASKGRPPGRVDCRPLLASTATLLATPSAPPPSCAARACACASVLGAGSAHSADRATPSSSMRRPKHRLARFTTRPRQRNAPRRRRPGCSSPSSSSRLHARGYHSSQGRTGTGRGIDSAPHGRPAMQRSSPLGGSLASRPINNDRDAVSGSAAQTHVPCSHTR